MYLMLRPSLKLMSHDSPLYWVQWQDHDTRSAGPPVQCSVWDRWWWECDQKMAGRWQCQADIFLLRHLWLRQCYNVFIMSRDTTIAWWRTIKFSLTFIRSVSICSGLTTISPLIWYSYRPRSTDNEWYLIKSVRELPLQPCSAAWSALQCNAARVSDH